LQGNDFGWDYGDPTGTLMAFPYAILNRDGGQWDRWFESISLGSRSGRYPYYMGSYRVGVTDGGLNNFYGEAVMYDAWMWGNLWQNGTIWAGYSHFGWACPTTDHWFFPFDIVSTSTSWWVEWPWLCGNAGPYANPYTERFDYLMEKADGMEGSTYINPKLKMK